MVVKAWLAPQLSQIQAWRGERTVRAGAEYRHGQVDSHSVWILIFGCCILKIFFSLSHIELECLCLKTFVSSALCLNTFVNSALC